MTIVPKDMFLLDGKLVRKPRLWLGRDRASGVKVWFCGYKDNLRSVFVGSTPENAFRAWRAAKQKALISWGKL